MKKILFLLVLISMGFTAPPLKVVFFGDSITEAGVKEGGYIQKIKALDSSGNYDFIGAGISGNKVYDLYLRLESDVLAQNPDIVVIFVGVNDVWHKSSFGTGTDSDKFIKFYQAIIDKLKSRGIKVLLCTPAAIGERIDFSNQQDGDLNLYSNNIRKLATENNCTLIDLRNEFLVYNLKNNSQNAYKGSLTSDGVHLNEKGNDFVANLMLEGILKAK